MNGVLDGVTNGDLLGLVEGLPKLDAVCSQLSAVTGQTNLLRSALGGLSLNGVLSSLGGLLNIPALPPALTPFTCPA